MIHNIIGNSDGETPVHISLNLSHVIGVQYTNTVGNDWQLVLMLDTGYNTVLNVTEDDAANTMKAWKEHNAESISG